MKAHHSRAQHMTSHCITWHDTTQDVTSHQITWHDNHITWHVATNHITSSHVTSQSTRLLHLTRQPTSWHHNTSHHHHGTVEGSFTPKSRFGHPLPYSFFPFETSACPALLSCLIFECYLIECKHHYHDETVLQTPNTWSTLTPMGPLSNPRWKRKYLASELELARNQHIMYFGGVSLL